MNGHQYLINRVAELEHAVSTLLDQVAAEKARADAAEAKLAAAAGEKGAEPE